MALSANSAGAFGSPQATPKLILRLLVVLLERIIFDLRYVLVLAYVGMSLALASYMMFTLYKNVTLAFELWYALSPSELVVSLLEAIDAIMIGNVVYLIIAGSYSVYVRPKVDDMVFEQHNERPLALQHLTPATLKEKMAAALVGVTSVHLVQVLIESDTDTRVDWFGLTKIVVIHLALIIGAYVFYRMGKGEEKAESLAHGGAVAYSNSNHSTPKEVTA